MSYTNVQKQLLLYTQKRVIDFCRNNPAPAHGLDHAERVAAWTKKIIEKEQVTHPLLCELSAWFHDIGRVPEHYDSRKERHHELSYELLRQWFREDRMFDQLTDSEKIEILYAVRFHWNDEANEYDTAWILRDADKMDCFGDIGITRMKEFFGTDEKKIGQHLRDIFQIMACIRTDAAKQFLIEENLFEPISKFREKSLRDQIETIEL